MVKNRPKKICIVTPTYISCNPRVVKEADALWNTGFDVMVVFSQGDYEWAREHDEILLKEKPWKRRVIRQSSFRKGERMLYLKSRLRHNIFRRFPLFLSPLCKIAEYGEGRVYKELARAAASEEADLYIGHYPEGLAAASYAAWRREAKLGYDAEDFHTGESPPNNRKQIRRIEIIERRYLPHCSHITAVSELVADEMARRYNIARPLVIHNVFPWRERENMDGQIKDRKKRTLSLYWYSQVIGEDRGIQDVIRAAGLLKDKVEIHLRGTIYEKVKNKLLNLARQHCIEGNLYFHPPVPPIELLSRTAEHDIGLALELSNSLNHMLTVSNKLFFYLLAGLAVATTDTPGQRYIMSTCPDTGFLYKPGDYRSLADNLNKMLLDPMKLELRKEAALKTARNRWNWERESEKLAGTISRLLKG